MGNACVSRSNDPNYQQFTLAQEKDFSLEYETVRQLSMTKNSAVLLMRERNTKMECVMRNITCYDKKKHPKADTKEHVFYIHNTIQKKPLPRLPLIFDISAKREPLQVLEQKLDAQWMSLRQVQNNEEEGALSERVVSAAILYILEALKHLHKQQIVHCNIDQDHIYRQSMPFGGDNYKLVDFTNSRIANEYLMPNFQNEKARKSAFVAPEIADAPLTTDGKSKSPITGAIDIWSLGVLTFNLRSGCLPMTRNLDKPPASPENPETQAKEPVFNPEEICNSEQYVRIFSEDQRDFLIKCMHADPKKRATAEQLLVHPWIVKNEQERQRQFAQAKESRLILANQIKDNYDDLLSMSEFEIDLLRALYASEILNDRFDHIDNLFSACDFIGGPDGAVSFDEIIKVVDNMGVFVKPKPGLALQEGDVTLDDLIKVLDKIDINKNRHLDEVEFMLLACNRRSLLSKKNIIRLFRIWQEGFSPYGVISLFHHVRQMIINGNSQPDETKISKLNNLLRGLEIIDPDTDDDIDLYRFLRIVTEIIGVNTFEINEDPDREMASVEAEFGYVVVVKPPEPQRPDSDVQFKETYLTETRQTSAVYSSPHEPQMLMASVPEQITAEDLEQTPGLLSATPAQAEFVEEEEAEEALAEEAEQELEAEGELQEEDPEFEVQGEELEEEVELQEQQEEQEAEGEEEPEEEDPQVEGQEELEEEVEGEVEVQEEGQDEEEVEGEVETPEGEEVEEEQQEGSEIAEELEAEQEESAQEEIGEEEEQDGEELFQGSQGEVEVEDQEEGYEGEEADGDYQPEEVESELQEEEEEEEYQPGEEGAEEEGEEQQVEEVESVEQVPDEEEAEQERYGEVQEDVEEQYNREDLELLYGEEAETEVEAENQTEKVALEAESPYQQQTFDEEE